MINLLDRAVLKEAAEIEFDPIEYLYERRSGGWEIVTLDGVVHYADDDRDRALAWVWKNLGPKLNATVSE